MYTIRLTVALSVFAVPCAAQGGGAIPIRIPVLDGAGVAHCIGPKDQVWLTLRRVITTKSGNWFTSGKSVVSVMQAALKSSQGKPLSFPLTTEATIAAYPTGQISVPLEYSLIEGLPLTQGGQQYTGLQVEMTFVNKTGKTHLGNALAALASVAGKLPIPANPIGASGSYLMDFAKTAVASDLAAQDANDRLTGAALALTFDPSGQCKAPSPDGTDFESTGTIAVLQGTGIPGPNLIDLSKTNDFCWSAELRPGVVLKAAPKENGVPCTDPKYKPKFQAVSNNYTAFFLNAVPFTGVAGVGVGTEVARKASIARCAANGVPEGQCLKTHR